MLAFSANAQYKKPVMLNDPEYDVGKRLRFGFSIGINTMDFTTKNSGKDSIFADVSHLIPGFNVNAVVDYRLSEYFHLRFLPGYAFGQRNMNFFSKKDTMIQVESSFIDLPVSIKYSAERVTNARPYLLFGGNYRIDLATSKKSNDQIFRLAKGDIYYEIGFGYDFFMQYFKFSVELKYSVGVLNVLSKGTGKYVQAIDKLNSQLFIVAFHFE